MSTLRPLLVNRTDIGVSNPPSPPVRGVAGTAPSLAGLLILPLPPSVYARRGGHTIARERHVRPLRSSHATQRRHEPRDRRSVRYTLSGSTACHLLSKAARATWPLLSHAGALPLWGSTSTTPSARHTRGSALPPLLHATYDILYVGCCVFAVRFSLATPKSALVPSTREHDTPLPLLFSVKVLRDVRQTLRDLFTISPYSA